MTKGVECYCSIPTKIKSFNNEQVTKISCGAAHTACVTEFGKLWVWGCGDGGRLGLGSNNYRTIYNPLLVESLSNEVIYSVSCGNSTTLVATQVGALFHHWWAVKTSSSHIACFLGAWEHWRSCSQLAHRTHWRQSLCCWKSKCARLSVLVIHSD